MVRQRDYGRGSKAGIAAEKEWEDTTNGSADVQDETPQLMVQIKLS